MKKEKKSNIKFEDLPDTITPFDYAEWRGIGENKAREIFNSKGFPRIQGVGVKQLADKRAVFIHEFCTDDETKKVLLEKIAKQLFV